MIDPITLTRWRGRFMFFAVAMALIFMRLLPLGGEAGQLPGPDWLVCIIFALMMRRPEFLPLWLLVVVLLLEDIFLMRPLGLWAALVILAAEVVRTRTILMRELSFLMEWAVIAALMLGMMLAYRLAYALALMPQVSFGYALVEVIWSIIAYPGVVMISRYVLALKKPALGEVDNYGRRF